MLHSEYWHLILKNENRIIHNSDRKYRYHCKSLESMGEELVYLERSRFCDADPMEYLLMQDFIDTVRNERLADALRRLTKRQQLIIELHYWKGYKLREIAVILGCAPNTVSQVLAHARHALQRAMTK